MADKFSTPQMMINTNHPSVYKNKWLKRFNTQLKAPTKVVKPTNTKML